jgi:hypothetical protein
LAFAITAITSAVAISSAVAMTARSHESLRDASWLNDYQPASYPRISFHFTAADASCIPPVVIDKSGALDAFTTAAQ